MKKNGFTLVELIAIIGVLALIMIISAPMITKAGEASRKKAYETKMDLIEDDAVMYGQDNYRHIVDCASACTSGYTGAINCSTECGTGYKEVVEGGTTYRTSVIYVKDLIPEYYTADSDDPSKGQVTDPRNNEKYLDNYQIKIKINKSNRKVTAEVCHRDLSDPKNCD